MLKATKPRSTVVTNSILRCYERVVDDLIRGDLDVALGGFVVERIS